MPMREWKVPAALTLMMVVALSAIPARSQAADDICRHAVSLVGEPKMPAGYDHFDWVNPNAPKGGTLRIAEIGSYDSLNPFTIQGSAADGLGSIFDSLFASSPDEPSTAYGLVAECVTYPEDYSSATFKLRPEARFNDGTPITPEDVVFSLDALKAANPQTALYYKNVVKAEKTGDHDVTFHFDVKGNRELPMIISELTVLSKAYWSKHDVTKSMLDVPLGSGPYRIKSFEPGRNIVYERVADYWAKDLPVSKGQWNYDVVRHEYYRERLPAFEAFKNGLADFWTETSSSAWATQYDFPAFDKGEVKKELLPHHRVAGMQSFTFNLRRKQFSDPRVRRGFGLAFDFEELNKKLFYGAYKRLTSYFDNSELKATGLPQGRELEILNEVKSEVPPEVFTNEWKPPVNNSPEDLRNHFREAIKLFRDAGWTLKGRKLTNAAGEQMSAEFLVVQPDFERVVLPYIENLKKLGINATIRVVDSSQYERRVKSFDFDIIVNSIGQSHSPGNEQRFFFGSAAANREGSRNVGGIHDPAIDKLIDKIVFAKDRDDLVAATHALDRVLMWNFYVVPQWYLPSDRVAYWDIFGRPEKLPSEVPARIEQTWWIDPAKAKAVDAARAN
jgi:microcin C transport system substrate-binding protein